MIKWKPFLHGLLLFIFIPWSPPTALAEFYRYTDSKGSVCMTNKLDTVPKEYRSTVKVIRNGKESTLQQLSDEPPQAVQDPSLQKQENAPADTPVPKGRLGQLAARFPWLKPLLIVGGILTGFLLVARITAHLPSAQLGKIIYLAFFLGVFTFAYKSYADHVCNSYFTIKHKVVSMFKKANDREGLRPADKPAAYKEEDTQ